MTNRQLVQTMTEAFLRGDIDTAYAERLFAESEA